MMADSFIVTLACLTVAAIMVLGINAFRVGTADSAKKSNTYMRWRIAAQFLAVLLIVAFVYYRQYAGG
ncbi:MAG: twin transmembrane helix small protein [Rhodobacteraceae bacterium]|nr:twin transmembrane helix small protein [Paracoccaceae bacterium]